MGQKMAAFKMHPNGGDSGVGGGTGTLSTAAGENTNNNHHHQYQHHHQCKSSTATAILSTLQRHRKNKIESATGTGGASGAGHNKAQLSKVEEKREKRSSFKTFFSRIGSRGLLLYTSRQDVTSTDIMDCCDQKQPLVIIRSEKEPGVAMAKRKSSTLYHRHSLTNHSRSEFFTYVKCDDPTDGLSLERRSEEETRHTTDQNVTNEGVAAKKDSNSKKTSTVKRSHFPYSFLRSKLGPLIEDDKHHLLMADSAAHQGSLPTEVDLSRQSSITSLDYQQRTKTERHHDEATGSTAAVVVSRRQLVIRRESETEDVGIVTRLKLLPNIDIGQMTPVVTGMMENGAAFR